MEKARRVLVIDAQPDSAGILARSLELSGYEVKTAYDGPTALELACDFNPGIVGARRRPDGHRRLRSCAKVCEEQMLVTNCTSSV